MGSPEVLDQPNKIVLSKKTAEKYFGQWQEATGKYIRLDNLNTLQVAGIIQDPPGNSDFQYKAIGSYPIFKSNSFYPYSKEWNSTSSSEQLYVLLPPAQSASAINAQLLKYSKERLKKTTARSVALFFLDHSV